MNNQNDRQDRIVITMLRLCTFLLAAVSFWATAQGMKEYTFPTDWQAYAASLGIQGLLLGLNFSLPSFWRKSRGFLKKAGLLLLTIVVLFCSSWFSYLYIAGQAYGKSWETECRLQSQDIYRNELFSAEAYAEAYAEKIEQELSDQVVELYQQATEMGTGSEGATQEVEWDTELDKYAPDGSAAREIMESIINTVRPALEPDAAQDVRQRAMSDIGTYQSTLQGRLDSLTDRIADVDARVSAAYETLKGAQNRLKNAPVDVDKTPYRNAADIASRSYQSVLEQQSELVRQRDEYQKVLYRLEEYGTLLGSAQTGMSNYYVGEKLREIQRELFSSVPDSKMMLNLATEVFERLQSGIDLGAGDEDAPQYQRFLSQMNLFVKNLENYQQIKKSYEDLQELVDKLAEGEILSLEGSVPPEDVPPSADPSVEVSGQVEDTPATSEDPGEAMPSATSEPGGASSSPAPEMTDTGAVSTESEPVPATSDSGEATPTPSTAAAETEGETDTTEGWESAWLKEFNTLKAKISGLPVYTAQTVETGNASEAETDDALRFDRADSTKRLDDGIRDYLTLHNPAQQGIIYLLSPYWTVAVFSLFIAFMLDISAFITGVVIDRVETSTPSRSKPVKASEPPLQGDPESSAQEKPDESPPEADTLSAVSGLKRYVFLTGDYHSVNGSLFYEALERGQSLELQCAGSVLKTGLYVWDGTSAQVPPPAPLLFKGSDGGPQDGVYADAVLHYEEPVLSLMQNGVSTFLGHADPQTPVFHMSRDLYEVYPASKIEDAHGTTVVAALDEEGKIIIGLYVAD